MITTGFIYLAGILISGMLLILSPLGGDGGFPEGIDTSMTFLATYIGYADVFFPIQTLFQALTFAVTFEITIFTFYVLRWLFSYMPFVGR